MINVTYKKMTSVVKNPFFNGDALQNKIQINNFNNSILIMLA